MELRGNKGRQGGQGRTGARTKHGNLLTATQEGSALAKFDKEKKNVCGQVTADDAR